MNRCTIPDINMFNNFRFEETGIRMWLGYGIGQGRFIAYGSLKQTPTSQGNTGLIVS
jgi:hypothetical protein